MNFLWIFQLFFFFIKWLNWSDLKLDSALIVVTLAHGDVVWRSLPLNLAHCVRVLERAPLQGNLWSSCDDQWSWQGWWQIWCTSWSLWITIAQCVKGGGVRKMFFSEKTLGLFWSIGPSYWMFILEVHVWVTGNKIMAPKRPFLAIFGNIWP